MCVLCTVYGVSMYVCACGVGKTHVGPGGRAGLGVGPGGRHMRGLGVGPGGRHMRGLGVGPGVGT